MSSFRRHFEFMAFCIQNTLFPFQAQDQIPIGASWASRRKASGQDHKIAVFCLLLRQVEKSFQVLFPQGGSGFIQLGNALFIFNDQLQICPHPARRS